MLKILLENNKIKKQTQEKLKKDSENALKKLN